MIKHYESLCAKMYKIGMEETKIKIIMVLIIQNCINPLKATYLSSLLRKSYHTIICCMNRI